MATNVELKAADFKKQEFYLNVNNGKADYPNGALFAGDAQRGHIFIPFYKPLLNDLQNRIEKL